MSGLLCPQCREATNVCDTQGRLVHCHACGSIYRQLLEYSDWLIPQDHRVGPFELVEPLGSGGLGLSGRPMTIS